MGSTFFEYQLKQKKRQKKKEIENEILASLHCPVYLVNTTV